MKYKEMYPWDKSEIYIPKLKYWIPLFPLIFVKRYTVYPADIIYHERVIEHVLRLARRLYNLKGILGKKLANKLAEMGTGHDLDEVGITRDVTEKEKGEGVEAKKTLLARFVIWALKLKGPMARFDAAYAFEKASTNGTDPLTGFDEADLIHRICDIIDGNLLWWLSYVNGLKKGTATEKNAYLFADPFQYTIDHFNSVVRILGNKHISIKVRKLLRTNLLNQWEVIVEATMQYKLNRPRALLQTINKLEAVIRQVPLEKVEKVWR